MKNILILFSLSILLFTKPAPAQNHYHLLKKTVIGGEGGWDFLSIDEARRHLYISHGNQVDIYDLEKDTVVGHVYHTEGSHGVAIASAEGHGFVTCGKSNSVLMFDLNSFDTLKRISVGEKPDAIIYDPSSKHIFVMNGNSKDISVLDPKSGKNIATIKLTGAPEFAVADNEGHVFVNLEDKSVVVKLDSKKNKFDASWALAPGEAPTGLAIDRKSKTLFSACANEKLITVNAKNGKIKDVVKIGKGVDAVIFDPELGNVITSNGDATATLITAGSEDWINASVAENIPTVPRARTLALDPRTHDIYFVSAEFEKEKNEKGRPSVIPGTFYVLKYGLK